MQTETKQGTKHLVRIRARQMVSYDQMFEMTEEQVAEIRDAITADDEKRIRALLETWLDLSDIDDGEEFDSDDCSFALVDPSGKHIKHL